jgi:hypothetical protein
MGRMWKLKLTVSGSRASLLLLFREKNAKSRVPAKSIAAARASLENKKRRMGEKYAEGLRRRCRN